MIEKRVSSEQEIAYRYKLDGVFVRHSCDPIIPGRCEHYGAFRCVLTGEEINWPASGPVGDRCPLPGYEYPLEEVRP